MAYVVAIIVGAIIGLIASLITETREGWLANILVGVVGAALGRWLFADVLGIGGANAAGAFSLGGLFWGVVGSVILIAILRSLNLFGYGNNRLQ